MTDPFASFDASVPFDTSHSSDPSLEFDESITFADVDPGEDQRWSTWPAITPSERGPAPWPDWVVTSAGAIDTELGVLKTGKEADVFLIERAVPDSPAERTLLAAKRYRSPEHRSFHRSGIYTEGRSVQKSRDARALAKKTAFGREVAAAEWSFAEFDALSRMWQLGAPVPYPVQVNGTELLMEFIGTDATAAPRLAQVRGDRAVLADCYAQIVAIMHVFAGAGFAHGDLSPYNLLVHDGRVRVIDLPQIVDIIANPQGLDLLHRDCVNVCEWFARRRVDATRKTCSPSSWRRRTREDGRCARRAATCRSPDDARLRSMSAPENSAAPTPEGTANSGAVAVIGLELRGETPAPKKQVYSWALWDWATQPFNTVILTFIFTALYLTTDAFLPPEIAALDPDSGAYKAAEAGLASGLGLGSTIAALAILVLAPVLGQRADAAGRQKLWLGIGTGALILCMFGLWFVEPAPALFWVGIALISAGSVFGEIAAVNSNAMLIGIANPKTVGKISGLGWGFGYIGGVVALVIVIVFYAMDWFGLSDEGGLPFRLIAVGCAVWAIIFSIPNFLNVPEPSLGRPERRVGFFRSYVLLTKDVISLYRSPETRPTFWFLLASAVFRDGLGGIFAFGAIIAGQVFGFKFLELAIFGIAANLIAGLSTILAGRLDDRFGPKRIILVALGAMIVAGLAVFLLVDAGTVVFWIGGLLLCAFVGPAQAASRSFLARVTPAGREGEIFGLYATTGRAASWMASGAWTLLIVLTSATAFGILGIVLVLLIGFLLLLPVKAPQEA